MATIDITLNKTFASQIEAAIADLDVIESKAFALAEFLDDLNGSLSQDIGLLGERAAFAGDILRRALTEATNGND